MENSQDFGEGVEIVSKGAGASTFLRLSSARMNSPPAGLPCAPLRGKRRGQEVEND